MPATIRPGDVLAERYLLIDLLSEAGDGRFWRAHDRVLARHVAIHVLPANTPRSDELLEAARGCARLTDRRFLRVLDAEVKDATTYVVTEWGTGTSLQLMLEHAPLAPRRAAWMVGEVAGAIAAAHAVGVTHGRLAPENVLVDLSGTVRIIGASVDAALKGLPRASEADDVHELVALLYAGLTGRWAGRSPSAMPAAPLEAGHVLRPRQVRAGIPRVLDELCDDVLNSGSAPRAPFDLTTARGIADYLREYVGDPASMAAAEAERGSTATGQFPPVPAALLKPAPAIRPHDTQARIPSVSTPRPAPTTPVASPKTDGGSIGDDSAVGAGKEKGEAGTEVDDPIGPAERTRVRIKATPREPIEPPEQPPAGENGTTPAAATQPTEAGRTRVRPADTFDVPTQAGVPIFDDAREDVGWMARRTEKPQPPPEFEEPPERPLFAPETEEQAAARRRAVEEASAPASEDYWPWATGHHTGAILARPVQDPGARRAETPGRTWLQLAGFLGALVALLLIVVVAYQVLAPGGGSSSDEDGSGSGSSGSTSASGDPEPSDGAEVTGFSGTALDPPPAGNGEENDDQVPLAYDGDASTAWSTLRYDQQFGPGGLKNGVGIQLDLGGEYAVSRVQVTFQGETTSALFFVTADPLTEVADDLEPAGSVEDSGAEADVEVSGTGRYLTIWLTSLPQVEGGFSGGIAEVKVFE